MTENNKGMFSTHKPDEDVFNQYLSWVDLEKDPDFTNAWKAQDLNMVESLLYKYGCDLNSGWTLNYCAHRPRTSNQAVNSVRFEFKERNDKEFIASGMKAVEDIINDCDDCAMRIHLKAMSRRQGSVGGKESKENEE